MNGQQSDEPNSGERDRAAGEGSVITALPPVGYLESRRKTMKAIRNPTTEPEWDTIGIRCTDFRPHFDGDLVNVFSVVRPSDTKSATKQFLASSTREIARWILAHRTEFGRGDRFQIILGWPESIRRTGRQIIKAGGDYDALAKIIEGTTPIVPRPGWAVRLFDEGDA